jgi:hypothetical protein
LFIPEKLRMETRSSTSKRKTGADTPSSQGEDEPISEPDFFSQLPAPTEAESQFIDEIASGGTSVCPRTRSQTRHESVSKSILERALLEEVVPTGGTSSTELFTIQTGSHIRRDSESKDFDEIPTKRTRASPPPGPMRASTTIAPKGYKDLAVATVEGEHSRNPEGFEYAVPLEPGVNEPLGELIAVDLEYIDEEQGPI